MGAGSAEAAARYSVRPLLPGPADALRDAVLRLGLPPERLTVLARRGAVEALALRGLSSDQIRVLERLVADGGGEVLSNADGDRAVLLMPLMAAGSLPMRLAAWSENAGEVGAAIGSVLMARGGPPPPLEVTGHRLEFGSRTLVMGILNVTPDSFSGDGVGDDIPGAVARALSLADEGADVIDIGGESTRPSRSREEVSAEIELSRVLPVVRVLSERLPVPISIDTRKATVAAAALDAGAVIVNDVWGLRGDPDMAAVIASHPGTGVVAMHNQRGTEYGDLMEDVCLGLRESLAVAEKAGIHASQVIIDPGFGFAKTPAHNLELIRRLGELKGMGHAVLIGPSRKSTTGLVIGEADQTHRLEPSLALAVLAVQAGAHMVRVHDVAATVRALRAADAVVRGTPDALRDLPIPGPTG
ncbi:MAG TPA: dihydropteroate synthase [Candidatus Saccharimonadales bacterium]|nr:dihydropteroate synthase [Candidatus Saccharimonadales bacterium]